MIYWDNKTKYLVHDFQSAKVEIITSLKISPPFCAKKLIIITPGYYLRKYGSLYKINQASVVQKVDSAIRWINHYPVDNAIGLCTTYPVDGAIQFLNNWGQEIKGNS